MTRMTSEQIAELEKIAELNDGHCDRCHQTIKFYRYNLHKSHAIFLRAMADEVRNTGVNDVDKGALGLGYSVQTQTSKMRQHGLIARIKNEHGAQIPRRWLITHKGWQWLNGNPIPKYVVVFNNQVLGHDGNNVTIHEVLGEKFNPATPIYEETPVSEAEARTYAEVRQPLSHIKMQAIFRGRNFTDRGYRAGDKYELTLERLQVGKPVKVLAPQEREYHDIAAFQKDWKAI